MTSTTTQTQNALAPATTAPAKSTPPVVRSEQPRREPESFDDRVVRIIAGAQRRADDAQKLFDEVIGLVGQYGTATCSFCGDAHVPPDVARHLKVSGKQQVTCAEQACASQLPGKTFGLGESLRRRGEQRGEAIGHVERLRELSQVEGFEAKGARDSVAEQLDLIEDRFTAILGKLEMVYEDGRPVYKHGRPIRERIGGGELAQAEQAFEAARQAAEQARLASGAAIVSGDLEARDAAKTAYDSAQQIREDQRMLVHALNSELRRLENAARPWHECRAVIAPAPRRGGGNGRRDGQGNGRGGERPKGQAVPHGQGLSRHRRS